MDSDIEGRLRARLEAKEAADIEHAAAQAAVNVLRTAETLCDEQLQATGQQLRERMVASREEPKRWHLFGRKVLQVSLSVEHAPGHSLREVLREVDADRANGMDDDTVHARNWERAREGSRLQIITITTPPFVFEPDVLDDEYRFRYGWQFALKAGFRFHDPQQPEDTYRSSPIYIYRYAAAVSTDEEEQELRYILILPDPRYRAQQLEVQSYTDGQLDDELQTVGKDSKDQVLSLMQQALKQF